MSPYPGAVPPLYNMFLLSFLGCNSNYPICIHYKLSVQIQWQFCCAFRNYYITFQFTKRKSELKCWYLIAGSSEREEDEGCALNNDNNMLNYLVVGASSRSPIDLEYADDHNDALVPAASRIWIMEYWWIIIFPWIKLGAKTRAQENHARADGKGRKNNMQHCKCMNKRWDDNVL